MSGISAIYFDRWLPDCDGLRYTVWIALHWACKQTNGRFTSLPDVALAVVDDFGNLVEVHA
ncbi:hypothetical protein [Aquabacterium sp.]|uniref:hypothetical protein n=1 Tax=Aquabacterium sp. TaxID=1872578 RepID=UPI0025C01E33|nr:hypothetical protein [Aquabacterium sp.]